MRSAERPSRPSIPRAVSLRASFLGGLALAAGASPSCRSVAPEETTGPEIPAVVAAPEIPRHGLGRPRSARADALARLAARTNPAAGETSGAPPATTGFPLPSRAVRSAPPRTSLRRALRETSVAGFAVTDEESLAAVLAPVQVATGLPIVVHPSAENAAFDAGVTFDLRLPNPIAVERLLDLVVELAGNDVVWTVRHGVALVTTRERAPERMALAVHDVRVLVAPRRDWISPRLDRLQLLGDADDGEAFGAVGEARRPYEPEQIVDLVVENIEPASWDEEGASIQVVNGLLFVRNTPDVHARVRRFLAALGS